MLRHAFLAALAGLLLTACAQSPTTSASSSSSAKPAFEPHSGQPGKDVVWVPTPQALVDKMLDMAKVTSKDYVMDLGSGDGRTVITAARRGATAVGIEYNPDMVALSQKNAEKEGVSGKASFMKADLFETDFSKATVITMFLLPSINVKLRPKILALKPGTRVVSNSFTMDTWEADQSETINYETCASGWCTAHLWIVPAQFAGIHATPQGELMLEQRFQMISGTLKTAGGALPVNGKVRGEEAYFTAGGKAYRAKMNGQKLELLP
jgi:SAM-dependent methyltransferase